MGRVERQTKWVDELADFAIRTSFETVAFCFKAALCCLLRCSFTHVSSAARFATRLALKQNARFRKKFYYETTKGWHDNSGLVLNCHAVNSLDCSASHCIKIKPDYNRVHCSGKQPEL